MAMKLYSDVDIQDIADAIREVNGSSDTYKVSEMAAVIRTFTYEPVDLNLLTMNDGLINKRINSRHSAVNANGYFVSDYFDYDYSKKTGLRIVDAVPNIGSLGTSAYGNSMMIVYDSAKTRIGQWYISRNNAASESQWTADGNDLVLADIATNHGASIGSLATISDWTTVKYIRLGLALNNAASAIATVDDVLNSGMKIYAI